MKLYKYTLQQSALLVGLLFLFACKGKESEKSRAVTAETKIVKPAGQFPFYKDIAVKPGLNFEVVSWGKGVDSIGGYYC